MSRKNRKILNNSLKVWNLEINPNKTACGYKNKYKYKNKNKHITSLSMQV
jgi:hypothetical protein